uniref:LRRNT domain-containing protein n=3 Tax=Ciona intestinalis TaxID=7719 RepID=F6S4M7_CIOIN
MLHADHSGLQPNELGECGENTETSGAAAIPPDTTSYICPTHCGCFTSRVEYKAANSHPAPDYSFPLTSCMGNNNTELPTNIDARTHCLVSTNGLLEVLNVDELDHIEGLVSLDLKQNRISTLTGNHVFQSLTVLSLEHNLLTSITKRFLRNFPMLRKLRIYNNQIQYLAPRLFLYNRLLTKLFIGPNPLGGSFQGECFDNLQLINLGL